MHKLEILLNETIKHSDKEIFTTITIQVNTTTQKELHRLKNKYGINIPQIIRLMIEEYLKDNKEK
jgi:hypothetical protein